VASDGTVIGSGAVNVVRRVGPTAWTVLTVLAVEAESTGGSAVVRASVRSLASELGLDKDTIARALVRLREARLVVAEAGRFEHGTYRLTVPADVLQFTVAGPLDRRQARSPEPFALQLVLLEAD
jgi:hypothetical protein